MATYTLSELGKYDKRIVLVQHGDMRFPCTVIDARESQGRVDLQVMPLGEDGSGHQWLPLNNLMLVGRPIHLMQSRPLVKR